MPSVAARFRRSKWSGPALESVLCRIVKEGQVTETRKIAAILVADVVGYSRLVGRTRIAPWRGFGRSAAT